MPAALCMSSCGKKSSSSQQSSKNATERYMEKTEKQRLMLLGDEAAKRAEELTAGCIFRNTDYDEMYSQYGITGKRPDREEDNYPFIVVKTTENEPTGNDEIIAWSEATADNELMYEKDVNELKTVVWCRYYTKTASYGGTEEKGTSEGVLIYYVDPKTGQILDKDEIKAGSLDLFAVGGIPHYKIDHVVLLVTITDHIAGKDSSSEDG